MLAQQRLANARRALAKVVDALSEARAQRALAVDRIIEGGTELGDFVAVDQRVEALGRLSAEVRGAVAREVEKVEAERREANEAPVSPREEAADADAKAKRLAIWQHPRNAVRLFCEKMGGSAPDVPFGSLHVRYGLNALIRAGDTENGEPSFVVTDITSFTEWCATERPRLDELGWGTWSNSLRTRYADPNAIKIVRGR